MRSGSDLCEPDEIPAVERQILHRSLIDQHRHRRRFGLQQRRLGNDREMFFNRTHFELQTEPIAISDSQRDIAVDRFETLQFGRQTVPTRRKPKNLKIAASVGHGSFNIAGGLAARRDRHTGKQCSGRVSDGADDVGRRDLSDERQRDEDEEQYAE